MAFKQVVSDIYVAVLVCRVEEYIKQSCGTMGMGLYGWVAASRV